MKKDYINNFSFFVKKYDKIIMLFNMSKMIYFVNRIRNIQFKRMNEVLNREAKLNHRSKLKK